MIPAGRFRVHHQAAAVFIFLPAFLFIYFALLRKIVFIHKVVPRVIRRIDIDHPDLSVIAFLQEFQHFQVIPFDVEVFGIVEVDGGVLDGPEGGMNGRIDGCNGFPLARPLEAIAFLAAFHEAVTQFLAQKVQVNSGAGIAFGDAVREYGGDPRYIFVHGIGGCEVELIQRASVYYQII